MGPHAIKRRKLGHGSDGTNEHGSPSFEDQQTDSDEPMTNSVDEESTISEVDVPAASQMFKNHTWGSNPRDDSLIAGEMYKSSMFKLQIDELLAEIRPNYAQLLASAERVLRKLKATIERFPRKEPLTVRLDFGPPRLSLLTFVTAGS